MADATNEKLPSQSILLSFSPTEAVRGFRVTSQGMTKRPAPQKGNMM